MQVLIFLQVLLTTLKEKWEKFINGSNKAIFPICNYLVAFLADVFPGNSPGEGVILAYLEHSSIVNCCNGKELLWREEVMGGWDK